MSDYIRRMRKIETKEELHKIEEEIKRECPMVDFSQSLSDINAELLLGKRTEHPKLGSQASKKSLESSSESEEESQEINTKSQPNKR